MISGFFISGTGTDVGKTLVTAGILRSLLARGLSAMVMKPVQTGAVRGEDGSLSAPDVEYVLGAAGLRLDAETLAHVSPRRFEPACSPHLAAQMAGESIGIPELIEHAEWLSARYTPLLVEGAGGLLAPINENETMLDLMVALGMPVLLVGHSGLGAINHMLLSIEALRSRELSIAGVILTASAPIPAGDEYIHNDNVRTIARFGQVPVLVQIPFLGTPPALSILDNLFASCAWIPVEGS